MGVRRQTKELPKIIPMSEQAVAFPWQVRLISITWKICHSLYFQSCISAFVGNEMPRLLSRFAKASYVTISYTRERESLYFGDIRLRTARVLPTSSSSYRASTRSMRRYPGCGCSSTWRRCLQRPDRYQPSCLPLSKPSTVSWPLFIEK
jgi:hypothetical protein